MVDKIQLRGEKADANKDAQSPDILTSALRFHRVMWFLSSGLILAKVVALSVAIF